LILEENGSFIESVFSLISTPYNTTLISHRLSDNYYPHFFLKKELVPNERFNEYQVKKQK